MSRRRFISSLIALVLAAGPAFAAEAKPKVQGPITVTSETLTADNAAHTALFERNVVAKTSDITIHADKMLVFYRPDGGEVTKIEATGSVKLVRDARIITAQKAVYFADEEKVVFTGEPRAVDGENMVTGSKMTVFLKDDRSVVENSKVYLKSRKDR